MKVVIKAIATANLDDIQIKLESVWWDVKDVMPLFANMQILENSAGAGNWDFYIDIPMNVQGAQTGAGAALQMTVITDDGIVVFRKLVGNSVGQFEGGADYLILNTVLAPTRIIPRVPVTVAAVQLGTDCPVYSSRRYWYCASKTENALNGGASGTDVITFQRDLQAQSQLFATKASRKGEEQWNYLNNN